MKQLVLVVGLVLMLSGVAEASQFSNGLGKTWRFLTEPVNCVAQGVSQLVGVGAQFISCVLGNLNPQNLIP